MTPNEIRIAVAGCLGWKVLPQGQGEFDITGEPPDWDATRYHPVPNYPEDLNACHEIWCSLTEKEHFAFRDHLRDLVRRDGHICGPCRSLSNATALQRCEAFLKTKGKWK